VGRVGTAVFAGEDNVEIGVRREGGREGGREGRGGEDRRGSREG